MPAALPLGLDMLSLEQKVTLFNQAAAIADPIYRARGPTMLLALATVALRYLVEDASEPLVVVGQIMEQLGTAIQILGTGPDELDALH